MKITPYILTVLVLFSLPAVAELNPLLQASTKFDHLQVNKVIKPDTLQLSNGELVKLIGIEGPARPKFQDVKRDAHGFIIPDDDPTTPFEVEAVRFVKKTLNDRPVKLEFDAERRGDDGLLQAYVFLPDGKLLNEEILRFGYADLRLKMPNMKYADRFRKAYREARKEMRGMQGNW